MPVSSANTIVTTDRPDLEVERTRHFGHDRRQLDEVGTDRDRRLGATLGVRRERVMVEAGPCGIITTGEAAGTPLRDVLAPLELGQPRGHSEVLSMG